MVRYAVCYHRANTVTPDGICRMLRKSGYDCHTETDKKIDILVTNAPHWKITAFGAHMAFIPMP